MKKRLTFQCGNANCKRNFSFKREITEEQEFIFPCPFCNTELIVKLEPFKVRKKTFVRGEETHADSDEWEYAFPEVIPTQPHNP
ncbi:MAG: hypothetical protein KPEEDBHJ_02711 [Anaerolineales bacterium]|nr:hypothetical protein [Anaerolineales bacterium]